MKVSVVTISFNSAATIEGCVESVLAQRGVEVEYIVIDGGSRDATLEKLAPYRDRIAVLVSEPDRGVYDAMNKGLGHATGEVVGFLNSDDMFADPDALSALVSMMEAKKADCVFADIDLIDAEGRVARVYSAASFHPSKFERGYAVPHPSFYARTELVRRAGGFRPTFKIASDFELMIRLMRLGGASWAYLPRTVVRMRLGGVSTQGLKAYRISTRELIEALQNCGLRPNRWAIHARIARKGVEVLRGRIRRLLAPR
jgi:glycosyltransferase involved in cell wall biosynthesis